MLAQLTSGLDFHAKSLVLRAERQRVIASNIANADTPGYVARDLDFQRAMADVQQGKSPQESIQRNTVSHPRHMPLTARTGELGGQAGLAYVTQTQPSMDKNSVDVDQERGKFVNNAVQYESTLRFINGHAKTVLSAIQGQ